jgi:C4-dicarboxylate transporter DctM subunit
MNLYVVQGVRRSGQLIGVMRGVTPFLIAIIVLVGLIVEFPGIFL